MIADWPAALHGVGVRIPKERKRPPVNLRLLTHAKEQAKLYKARLFVFRDAEGTELSYHSVGLHLLPATLSGTNLCPWSTAGCRRACLNTAGHGALNMVQSARARRTALYLEQPGLFLQSLHTELRNHEINCDRKGLLPTARLNLTSDIEWEKVDPSLFTRHPTVQFYDYTKNPKRMMAFLEDKLPRNYHLTFSQSEHNEQTCRRVLSLGGNVTTVWRTAMPTTHLGALVIDGTTHDLRFRDLVGVVVGLLALGRARRDTTGFVQEDL